MEAGVTVTVTWKLKPEEVPRFVDTLQEMFATTRLRSGFRNIRLLRGNSERNEFILIEEWDEAQDFLDYMELRTERGDSQLLVSMVSEQPQIGIWAHPPAAAADASGKPCVLKSATCKVMPD